MVHRVERNKKTLPGSLANDKRA